MGSWVMAVFKHIPGALALTLMALAPAAHAAESQFGYVYTTDLLPAGAREIEQWTTWRHQKAGGQFDLVEGRTEYEMGITDRFQLATYLNYAWAQANLNAPDGTTTPPETFAERLVDPHGKWRATKLIGTSVEGIYRIWSPYTDPMGLAVYVEPTFGKGLIKLESRLIAQKNYLDDRLVIAGNVTVEQEGRRLPADPSAAPGSEESVSRWDHESDVNFGLASSYRFAPGWSAGAELLNEREYSSFSLSNKFRTNAAYYFGPNIHYGARKFFVTATFLEQLRGARDYTNSGLVVGGRNYADDFERYRLRVKFGYYF